MTSLATPLTLHCDPAQVARFGSLREFLAHRVTVLPVPAKTIAAKMGLSPSTLSRKLNAGRDGDTDTQRLNVDDLETYLAETGDFSAIEYLAAKYLASDEARRATAIKRVESLAEELAGALAILRGEV